MVGLLIYNVHVLFSCGITLIVRHDLVFTHCLSCRIAVTCDDVPAHATVGQVI